MTHLITADQLAKVREAYEEIKHVYKVAGWDMRKSVPVTEAIAILDSLQEVEVVGVFNKHEDIWQENWPEFGGTPLYGSKT